MGSAFLQCQNCRKTLFRSEFETCLHVCPACDHHHRLTAGERIAFTVDPGSFEELDAELTSIDSLGFPEYREKLDSAVLKTHRSDGMVTGWAKIEGTMVSFAVTDFAFMGGSMGCVSGEKIARALDRAADGCVPAVVFCASGGARMQEGLLSLMQMAKTTAAVERCRQARAPYIAVFTDPTMAGVLASYASIADIILAEPRAQVGFAGARVSKQAHMTKAPADFQTAEFCLKSGMIDRIVPRREMRSTLGSLVRLLGGVR